MSSDIAFKGSYRISLARTLKHMMVTSEESSPWCETGCVWNWIRDWSKRRAELQYTDDMKLSDCFSPQFVSILIGIQITYRFQTSHGQFMIGLPNIQSHSVVVAGPYGQRENVA